MINVHDDDVNMAQRLYNQIITHFSGGGESDSAFVNESVHRYVCANKNRSSVTVFSSAFVNVHYL